MFDDGTLRTEHLADALGIGPISAKVVVVVGPDEGTELALDTELTIGTDAECDLVLTDKSVSRRHARLSVRDGAIGVEDLGSRNGTFVGGTRVESAAVTLGSVLELGRTRLALHAGYRLRRLAPSSAEGFGSLVGRSVAMREVFAVLERVAPTDTTVLVEGESGTGKELVARSVHALSLRAGAPFIVIDCSAIATHLVESELFGHAKGAFTGAILERAGAFEAAHGGTIFLDEIGELPLELQPKLLRVLEQREVRRVGEDHPRAVDVRVVAATNRDLVAEANRGRFRSDLLYRLEVVKVRVPPLRHRPDDIPLLAGHLLRESLPPGDVIEGENLARLVGYAWPGNVRELRNCLRRAVALADPPVRFGTLPIDLGPAPGSPASIGMELPGVASPMPFKDAKAQLLASFERAYVEALMDRHGGSVTAAAAAAGLSRKHLYELLRRVDPSSSSSSSSSSDDDD